VLLVACTNLAGLLLARGAARQHEISIRAALGAGRFALARQLATENLLLAGAGGVLGLLLAQWGVRLLAHYIPEHGEAVHLQLTPDLKVLGFTLLISIGTGILFGLFPAWRSSRLDVVTALKDQAGTVMGRRSGQFWNKALMVTQIAVSCCLLIGAGLFVRTVQKLRTLDVGFDRENLMGFYLEGLNYDDPRRASVHEEVLQRVRNLPAVCYASMSNIQTLGGAEFGYGPFRVARADSEATEDEGLKVRGTAVALDYFQALGIPVLMGRDFGLQDEPTTAQGDQPGQSSRPIIIDQTCARKLFGDENPVGQLLRANGRSSREVIGVVGDVVHKGLRGGVRTSVYSLETCRAWNLGFFHVRTLGDPLAVADGIRQVVRGIDPELEVSGLHTMGEMINGQLRRERMLSQLTGFFSLSALALACLGLYGILSYAVTRRTREIGVRMALGAQRRNVLAGIIRQGMMLTLLGCLLGIILALALTRAVSSLLYGVTATDPVTFLLTVLLLGTVALLSCWLPARRAARVNPTEALRYE
ncbi:MAG: FtsX-like permease family protein, partial [Phycisphaerales bacterium]